MAKNDTLLWRTRVTKDGKLEWEGFPPYNIQKAVKELDPTSAGHAYAMQRNLIDSFAESELTDEERRLLGPVNDHINQLVDWHSRRAGVIQSEVVNIWNIPSPDGLFLEAVNEFETDAEKLWEDFKADQGKLLDSHSSKTKELNIFKENNELNKKGRHSARYPESVFLHLGVLFASLLIEGVANMSFFPQDLGLIGGFTTAFLVSLANVAVCFVVGWMFLRQLNHLEIYRKIIGGAVFVLALVVIFGLHSSVAHFRELAVRSPDATFFNALSFDPRGLGDVESLLLLAIGWIISVVAFWKGYTFDDPYPGFGEIYREWKGLDDRLLDAEKDYRKRVIDAHSSALTKIRAIPGVLDLKEQAVRKLSGEVGTYLQCVQSYHIQARDVAKGLITEFRTAVQRARGDASMPFDENLIDGSLNLIDPDTIESSLQGTLANKLNEIEAAKSLFVDRVKDIEEDLRKTKEIQIEKRVSAAGSGFSWKDASIAST